jgi:hypothetical protein
MPRRQSHPQAGQRPRTQQGSRTRYYDEDRPTNRPSGSNEPGRVSPSRGSAERYQTAARGDRGQGRPSQYGGGYRPSEFGEGPRRYEDENSHEGRGEFGRGPEGGYGYEQRPSGDGRRGSGIDYERERDFAPREGRSSGEFGRPWGPDEGEERGWRGGESPSSWDREQEAEGWRGGRARGEEYGNEDFEGSRDYGSREQDPRNRDYGAQYGPPRDEPARERRFDYEDDDQYDRYPGSDAGRREYASSDTEQRQQRQYQQQGREQYPQYPRQERDAPPRWEPQHRREPVSRGSRSWQRRD